MCAAVGAGMHGSLEEAVAASVRVTERLEPNLDSHEQLDARYAHYREVIDALEGAWEASQTSS
jgi:L-xylulokinase